MQALGERKAEVTNIKESLDEIKDAQKTNQAEILNLLRSMPR